MESAKKIAILSIGFNCGLVILKFLLARFSGSLALMAEVLHSLTDVVASMAIYLGIKFSKRRTPHFPYGLYKLENLTSLGVSLLIIWAGVEIIKDAFTHHYVLLKAKIPISCLGIGLIFLATYVFSRYEFKRAKDLNSPSLLSDAQHIRTDMFAILAVAGGLIGEYLGLRLDKVVAILVAGLVFKAGVEIFIHSIKVLLDASLDFATLDKVKQIALSYPLVGEVKSIWGRNSGRYKFIEMVITLKTKDLAKAHTLATQIEDEIRQKIPYVDHILIHYEPLEQNYQIYALPLGDDKNTIWEHFGDAPYFYFAKVEPKTKKIVAEFIEKNPYAGLPRGKGLKVSQWLLKKGVDMLVTPKDISGKTPFFVLSEGGVKVMVKPLKTLQEFKHKFFLK